MPGPSNSNLKRGEHIATLKGSKHIPHLWVGDKPAEFTTLAAAKKVAARVNGEAYESPRGGAFLIRFQR